MRTLLQSIVFAFTLALGAYAQDLSSTPGPPRATIEDAAWLTGRWTGEGFGGQLEETWSPPAGGQMVGYFRMVSEGQPQFYELLLIEEHEGGLRYRVKHFNPDFVGWEEKDSWHEFALVAASAEELRFDGLTLRRIGADSSDHILHISRNGAVEEQTLRYRRAPH